MSNSTTISIAFFGTHDFAATVLARFIREPIFKVKFVITQPDKAAGRHQVIQKAPVKKLAEQNMLPILQPQKIDSNIQYPQPVAGTMPLAEISNIALNIVCQYGMIIPRNILDFPKYGSLNIHASLLPKYRGASPIQAALLHGDKETGITIIKMDEKMDHGPIIFKENLQIMPKDNFITLSNRLANLAAERIIKILPEWVAGNIIPQTQDDSLATFTKLIKRDDGKIDFAMSSDDIYNRYRAFTPWPGIWCQWQSKRLKLLDIIKDNIELVPGKVFVDKNNLFVGCNPGSIKINRIQLEGKKVMATGEFINGYKALLSLSS